MECCQSHHTPMQTQDREQNLQKRLHRSWQGQYHSLLQTSHLRWMKTEWDCIPLKMIVVTTTMVKQSSVLVENGWNE
jgi:hypothetical protein